jgi:glycerate 2-kinase
MSPRKLLLDSFAAAVAAADPLKIVPRYLPRPPKGRTLVVGAGKAAASMAVAVERHWPSNALLEGLVITRHGHDLATRRMRVMQAGHPMPDERGEESAREILEQVKKLGRDDLLLCLLSGGGSSLLSLPLPGVPMAEIRIVTRDLLRSGASIREINTVRKHLSQVQGGRLAAACRGRVLVLIISDVAGDSPTDIASGPCAPDPTTYADALAILQRHDVDSPDSVRDVLTLGSEGRLEETPKPGDPVFRRVENRVIATAHVSLKAAAKLIRGQGVRPAILGETVRGEARDLARAYAALAREIRQHRHPWKAPVALISGGETTVTVRGHGRGGRCSEFLLSLVIELAGMKDVYALACDTDGIDGCENNAGAIAMPDSLKRAGRAGIRPERMLAENDAHGFFEALGDLVTTGPTRTSVNDYRIILMR